ncbi:MAG: RHS repeat-associated core domain-containing protein, partial [Myxococcota bacterium]
FGDPAACGGANYDAYYPGALLGVGGSALAIEQTRITDVNGDGFADLVRAGNDVRLRLGRVAGDFDPTITAPSFGAGDDNAIRIADIDGNLAVDIVRGENDWLYVTPGGDERAGLLYRVDNGLGKVTTIEYGSAIDEYIRDRQTGTFAWDEAPLQCLETGACPDGLGSAALNTLVVKAIETTDRFGELRLNELGEPDDQVSRTEFEYHDGAFGGEERSFWGFGVTDVCKLGDASQPTSCTRSHYHQARRPVALVGARNVPNPFLGLQGKAYLVETWVPGPGVVAQYGSSVHTSYGLRTWFGLDDHPIQQVAPTQIDTFSYPGHDYADGSEVYTLPGVVAEGPNAARNGTGTDAPNRPHYDSVTSHSVSIRAASFAHTRERIVRRSNFGKVMERVRDGRLRDEGDVAEQNYGESIFERMTPVLLNDGGQWVLVEARSSTSDGTSAGRETEYRHDSLGFVVGRSQRAAHSGIPFDFGSLGTTPAMLDLVETYRRNAWGAQIETCVGEVLGSAACLRNSMLEFDSAFARFPVVHTAETGDGSLTSTATFDGGLGLVTSLTEQNGVVRTAAYDGFGRLTATFVDPAGCAAPRETFHFDMAPAGAPVSVVTSRQYSDCSGTHSESRTYVDGLQRARATLAQDVAANRWTRSGLGLLNSHGASRRSYLVSTLDAATPNLAEALELPSAPFSSTTRDGFGRVIGTTDELGHASELRHGALSEERWEPDDLEAGGPHEGTPSIRRLDGHGREREQILVRRIPGVSGDIYVRLVSQYAATGDVLRLTRLASSDGAPIPAGASAPASLIPDQRVDRVFHRDTAGRLLAVEDPSLDASGGPAGERHWRYLHNTAGDLVAVRDPRGCGENYYFDRLGRRIGEELVDCDEAVPSPLAGAELPPFAVGMGSGPSLVHTRYFFDDAPSWTSEGFAPIVGSTAGRLVAVEGPTQRVLLEHDARARVVERQVQLAGTEFAAPLGSVSSLADVPAPTELGDVVYDAARTFSMTLHYDHADRLIRRDLPSDPDWAAVGGIGPAPTIAAHAELDPRRGLLARSWVSIDGGTYNVMRSATYHPGGGLSTAHIGAVGGGLHLSYGYDDRLRPISMSATRTPTAMADPLTRPLAAVGTIGALEYEFDSAGRLTGVRDLRDPLEWPEGFQPREQIIEHDSLGRVVGIDFRYAEQFPGTFAFGAEPATDWRTAFSEQAAIDPMRPSPAPRATDLPTDRVSSLTYDYNWLATRTEWTDDQHAFFDRSLGTAVTGLEVGGRPTAVYLWSNLDATTPSDLGGFAVFDYGDSGNVVGMTVRAQCTAVAPSSCTDPGGTNLAARVGALESGCRCATEQHYRYDYGARNELMLARRYDRNGSGDWEIAARQRDLHDESKTRRIQVVEHYESGGVTTRALQSVFPGTVERRGTRWDVLEGWEGTAALGTEMQYVTAGARLVWGPGATPLGDPSPSHRLTYRVTDALGTTGAVVDLVSNEVASVATFLPTGARETLLVDDAVFPVEPQGYTGKEEDVAVGLIYFGQRYLLSGANQWASPDPADIHLVAGGEALNPYEYVGGGVLSARDPDGLAPPEPTAEGYAGLDKMLAKFELTDDTIRKEDRERGFRLRVVRESSGLTVRDVRQLIESGEVETMNIIYVHNHGPATLLTSPGKGAFPRQQIGVRLHDLDAIDRSEGGWFGMVGAGELRYRSAAEYNTFMMDRMVNRGFSFGQAQAEFEADWQGLLDLTSEAAGSLLGAATFRGPLNKGTSRSSTTGVLENSRSLLDKGKKELPWWQIIRRINAGNAERLARAREIDAIPVGSLRRRFRQEVARPREE